MLAKLDGYKTYILAGLGVVVVVLNVVGVINADQMQHLLDVLGLGAFASIRSAIAKNATTLETIAPPGGQQ